MWVLLCGAIFVPCGCQMPDGGGKPKILCTIAQLWSQSIPNLKALSAVGAEIHILTAMMQWDKVLIQYAESITYCRHAVPQCLRPALITAIRSIKPDMVVPFDDVSVEIISDVRGRYEDDPEVYGEYVREVLSTSLPHYRLAANKFIQKRVAWKNGINTAPFVPLTTIDDAEKFVAVYGFPVVLKGSASTGGLLTKICRNKTDLEQSYRAMKGEARSHVSFFIETFIDVKIERFVVFTAVHGEMIAGVYGERRMKYKGYATILKHGTDDRIMDFAKLMIRVSDWHGAGIAELLEDHDGTLYLQEMMSRPQYGTAMIYKGAWQGLIDHLKGEYKGHQYYQEQIEDRSKIKWAVIPYELLRNCGSPFIYNKTVKVFAWWHDDEPVLYQYLQERYGCHRFWEFYGTDLAPSGYFWPLLH